MCILELRDISYYYTPDRVILRHVNASFDRGKVYTILGTSGCGKTTLLSLCGGLDIPKAGIIYCNKKNINDLGLEYHRQKNVSFVFQNYNLIDYMTPAENVLLSGKSDPFPILERLGLSPEESRRSVLKLSGGQQQRVAIARALASQSSIILADEPTGNLDEENAKEIAEVLKDSARRDEKCVIIVTHSKDLVEISDVVYELQDGVLKTKQYCGVKPTI